MALLNLVFICSILISGALANKSKRAANETEPADNEDWEANAQQVIDECEAEIPTESNEAFMEFISQPTANVSDKNVMCFVKSVGENWGLLNWKDGKLIAANLQKRPPQFLDVSKLKMA